MTTKPTEQQPTPPVYAYTDGHGHRIALLTTSDATGRPYVWVDAEDLAIGGAYASMWLTIEQSALLGDAIDTRISASFTDHTGDFLTIEPGDPHTVITVTRDPGDDAPGVVRVVVLTGRLPGLRAALKATAEQAQQRMAPDAEQQPSTAPAAEPLPQYLRYLFGRALHVQWGDLPTEDRLYWERQADAVRRAVQPAPALSDAEREFLSWALDQAANEMQLGSLNGGTSDDRAALASLRKLAGGEQA